jgi:hypothetical protein
MKFPLAILSVIATAPFDEAAAGGSLSPSNRPSQAMAARRRMEDLYLKLLSHFFGCKKKLIVWYDNIGSYATKPECRERNTKKK